MRAVRQVLAEKQVEHDLLEIDLLGGAHHAPEHLARHPFGKVPALAHGEVQLYETSAITRYLDLVFPEVPLTPSEPRQVGLMAQAIAVADSYAYPAMVGTVVIQRLLMPRLGEPSDEAAIEAALPRIDRCLAAFDTMLEGNVWLSGGDLGLADLHLAPMVGAFVHAPEAEAVMPRHPGVQRWWAAMENRASMAATAPRL